ncbi:MAG: hypothetical protein CL471_03615 [Acidobacteria bacterium]|nr:hypothetical protein [Acidobacteriota bacterium]
MFVAGNGNGRVEVFDLNDDGTLAQPTATYTLGKPSSHARRSHAGAWSESQTEFPGTLAIEHTNQRLFLVDNTTGQSLPGGGSQIMVFDIHPDRIATGADVLFVLGQPDANTKTSGLAANHTGRRLGLAVDETNQRLFVGDGSNNRILVFDIAPDRIATGMDAAIVLGQESFTAREPGLSARRMSRPGSLAYDATGQRLFVSDSGNNRVLVFDVAPQRLETFAIADDVMGQPDFETAAPRTDLRGFATGGLAYDDRTARLFIAEQVSRIEHMRITVYDVSADASLRAAEPLAVLGKPGFGAYDPIVSREQSVWPRLGSASIDSERQLLVATEGYPGGNRGIIWDISPERLRTGMPAVEVIGHLDDQGRSDFERRSANDRATPKNIYPRDVVLDPIDHRLFAIDQYNNRVLVWQLDRQNRVKDRDAHFVLGQPDLYSGELYPIGPTTIKIPLAVTYDARHKRVFVSDGWGNRILVFDADPARLRNGPEAIAVIGQADFTSITPATTRTGINLDTRVGTGITPSRPRGTGLAYDPVHDRLFVSDGGNHRVLGFDVAPDRLRSGMAASIVLGQPDFTTSGRNSTPTGLYQPAALFYESEQHRLFVADGNNNRVLVFDALPDRLVNGATPTVVIGQPDFDTFEAGRSRSAIDGPDGLAYDYLNDRLLVSDHGSDRILVFDAHPARLDNGPEAEHVIGQPDFATRQLGPVRANEIWDPRGLTFDSDHQRLYVSQGFASNIMIHDLARSSYEVDLPALAVQRYQSSSADTEVATQRGWAVATGPSALGGGAAMLTRMTTVFDELSQRESRVLISETGLGAPPLAAQATVFTDGRAGRTTVLSVSNPNDQAVTVSLAFRDAAGDVVGAPAERRIAGNGSAVWRLDDVQAAGPGSVGVQAERPLAVVATRITTNDRGEEIVTGAPVAYGPGVGGGGTVALPRYEIGGGTSTEFVVVNPSDDALTGRLTFFAFSGEPVTIAGASEVPLDVPAHGTAVWSADGSSPAVERGFAMVEAFSGHPLAAAIVSSSTGATVISERTSVGGSTPDAWFPVDTYPSVVRHGRTSFRLTLTNATDGTADVRLLVYDEDGRLLDRSYQILPGGRQVELSHVDLTDRGKFRGSIRVASDIPIAMTAEQETVNVRQEAITATVPSMTRSSEGQPVDSVVFPAYADGPEQATQLFLLNRGDAGRATFRFRDAGGAALDAILR